MKRTVEQELEEICAEHDGLLRAVDIVEYARNPDTALHEHFTWDDSEAAERFRLWEARHLIRVHVRVFDQVTDPIRMFVSLVPERNMPGGGYRLLEDVLEDEVLRAQLLKQALSEVTRWQKKYQALLELLPVFTAIDRVVSRESEPSN